MKTGERKDSWILPEGVQEVLPPQGAAIENLRRAVLDKMATWGYQFVMPPALEYIDSLLTGLGPDLDLQTFKLIDQLSGKTLGIPADMTPQIARLDSKSDSLATVKRYCYCGQVLHTLPDSFAGSRNPLQIGAELFGHDGPESDAEVIALLLEILETAEVESPNLELGDMGLFRSICDEAGLRGDQEEHILRSLLKKNSQEVEHLLDTFSVERLSKDLFLSLLKLNGSVETIEAAFKMFEGGPSELFLKLEMLGELVELLRLKKPDLRIGIDLAELKGYRYHSSTTFSVYTPAAGRAIAWGGRYEVSNSGQKLRAATGFSADLRTLFSVGKWTSEKEVVVLAPAGKDQELLTEITRLRRLGNVVIQTFSEQSAEKKDGRVGKQLVKQNGDWVLEDI